MVWVSYVLTILLVSWLLHQSSVVLTQLGNRNKWKICWFIIRALICPEVTRGQLPFVRFFLSFFINNNLSLCLQWLNSSCLLFRVAVSGLYIICHFSAVHSLQIRVIGEKGEALQIIPPYVVVLPLVLQPPDVAGQGWTCSIFWMVKITFMTLPPLLEGVGCQPHILLHGGVAGHIGLIDQLVHSTLSWQGTGGFVLAVALWLNWFLGIISSLSIFLNFFLNSIYVCVQN